MGYRVKNEKRWQDRQIPYQFNDNVPEQTRELIVRCMRDWEGFVNADQNHDVVFVEREAQARYVVIKRDDTGSTGNVLGSPTADGAVTFTLNLSKKDGRDDRASIPHELGHVLGLAHEHQRSRATIANGKRVAGTGDEAVTKDPTRARLYYSGGLQSAEDTYAAWDKQYVTFGDYDLQSIMHYPSGFGFTWNYNEYNKNKDAAVAALNYPTAQQVLDGAWRPSAGDIATVRAIYELSAE